MTSIWKLSAALALLASAACARDDANETADAGNAGTNMAAEGPTQAPSADATNATAAEQPVRSGAAGSILAWSRPAAGSTVSSPSELVFHFSPPARLGEVSVTGPDGAMPIMVTAVGEVEHYELPLSADTPGAYEVAWRATRQGREYQGSFGFTVR